MIMRKDWERIAEIIKRRITQCKALNKQWALGELSVLANNLAAFIKEENPSFKEAEFLERCGVQNGHKKN